MATEFELQVLDTLGEIKAQGAATAASLTALDARLFNGVGIVPTLQAEINELKDDAKKELWWDRAKLAIGPLAVALHIAAHKLGLKV